MNIADLKPRMGNVEIEVEVTEIGEVREFEKYGRPGRVATAIVKDKTGDISLSLWNEQIDRINVGDTLKISNGYVSEWQDKPQLTAGKFGTLEVVKKKK
ncbi:MAG: DNA-binding protein [Candidatus Altiarchaeota archaeon]|nr:DNA-binding protein [Candidatus Altiarchaeota archaeon]